MRCNPKQGLISLVVSLIRALKVNLINQNGIGQQHRHQVKHLRTLLVLLSAWDLLSLLETDVRIKQLMTMDIVMLISLKHQIILNLLGLVDVKPLHKQAHNV